MKNYENYALGKWIKGDGQGTPLYNAINGDQIGPTTKGPIPIASSDNLADANFVAKQ